MSEKTTLVPLINRQTTVADAWRWENKLAGR